MNLTYEEIKKEMEANRTVVLNRTTYGKAWKELSVFYNFSFFAVFRISTKEEELDNVSILDVPSVELALILYNQIHCVNGQFIFQ